MNLAGKYMNTDRSQNKTVELKQDPQSAPQALHPKDSKSTEVLLPFLSVSLKDAVIVFTFCCPETLV